MKNENEEVSIRLWPHVNGPLDPCCGKHYTGGNPMLDPLLMYSPNPPPRKLAFPLSVFLRMSISRIAH